MKNDSEKRQFVTAVPFGAVLCSFPTLGHADLVCTSVAAHPGGQGQASQGFGGCRGWSEITQG
eukprot:1147195-Amphidinium_carterae.1